MIPKEEYITVDKFFSHVLGKSILIEYRYKGRWKRVPPFTLRIMSSDPILGEYKFIGKPMLKEHYIIRLCDMAHYKILSEDEIWFKEVAGPELTITIL